MSKASASVADSGKVRLGGFAPTLPPTADLTKVRPPAKGEETIIEAA